MGFLHLTTIGELFLVAFLILEDHPHPKCPSEFSFWLPWPWPKRPRSMWLQKKFTDLVVGRTEELLDWDGKT